MDGSTFSPYALDCKRQVQFFTYPVGTSLLQARLGQVAGYEITQFVSKAQQSVQEVSVTLAWHNELYLTANQPKPRQVLEVRLEGKQQWLGFIQAVNDFNLATGTKSMTIVARTRDASPTWRNVQRVTDIYPVGTPLNYICQQILLTGGVDGTEIWLPTLPVYTVHSRTQLAQMTLWDMLTTMMQPAGYTPYVDALGRVKGINRDTQRAADVVLDDTRVLNVTGSKAKPPVNVLRVNWLDPKLGMTTQIGRKLNGATISTGFFQFDHKQDVWFSGDGSQRARNTYMVVRQSANSGLLPVCVEKYEQKTDVLGRIKLDSLYWSPILATASIVATLAQALIPDETLMIFSPNLPVGRYVQAASHLAITLVMMSVGTGVYEIWGEPFDYVHNRNKTDAYDINMQPWEENVQEVQCDFVMDEPMAQTMAVRELLYAYRSASSWSVTIVDDPRLEVGDIVQLKDGTRVYITGYSRDLSFGSPAQLKIEGFRC